MITRRKFLTSAGALAGSAAVLQKLGSAQEAARNDRGRKQKQTVNRTRRSEADAAARRSWQALHASHHAE